MVIIGILLVSLVCLVLGLVLASGPWLIASLGVSVVAAYFLWHQREQTRTRAENAAATGTGGRRPLVTGTAFAGNDASLADKRSDAQRRAGVVAGKDDVWVIDGKAHFHNEFCAQIEGQGADPVPVEQAVADGFTACGVCKPSGPRRDRRVWVVDGSPAYHEASCTTIAELHAEPVPLSQATADGFAPCTVCGSGRTGAAAPADQPRAAAPTPAGPGGVWVVDGRPRYHTRDCQLIAAQQAEQIPLAQATEDGFIPCALCEPAARSAHPAQPQV